MKEEKEWKVYLIRAGTKEHDPVKIGYTSDLDRRMYEIQVCNPYKIRLLCAIPCESREHARSLESFLHKQLHIGHGITGEWFDIAGRSIPKLLNKFTGIYKQSKGYPPVETVSGKSYNADWKQLRKENAKLKSRVKELEEEITKLKAEQEECLDEILLFQSQYLP